MAKQLNIDLKSKSVQAAMAEARKRLRQAKGEVAWQFGLVSIKDAYQPKLTGTQPDRKLEMEFMDEGGETFATSVTLTKIFEKWQVINPVKLKEKEIMATNNSHYINIRNAVISLIKEGDADSLRLANQLVSSLSGSLDGEYRRELHNHIAMRDMKRALMANEPVFYGVYDREADNSHPIVVDARFENGHVSWRGPEAQLIIGWGSKKPEKAPYINYDDLFDDEVFKAGMYLVKTSDGTFVNRVSKGSSWWAARVVGYTYSDGLPKALCLDMVPAITGQILNCPEGEQFDDWVLAEVKSSGFINQASYNAKPMEIESLSQIGVESFLPTWFHVWGEELNAEGKPVIKRTLRELASDSRYGLVDGDQRFFDRLYYYELETVRIRKLVATQANILAENGYADRLHEIETTEDPSVFVESFMALREGLFEFDEWDMGVIWNGRRGFWDDLPKLELVEIDMQIESAFDRGDFAKVKELELSRAQIAPENRFETPFHPAVDVEYGVWFETRGLGDDEKRLVIEGMLMRYGKVLRNEYLTDEEHEFVINELIDEAFNWDGIANPYEAEVEYGKLVAQVLGVPARQLKHEVIKGSEPKYHTFTTYSTKVPRRESPPEGLEFIELLPEQHPLSSSLSVKMNEMMVSVHQIEGLIPQKLEGGWNVYQNPETH